MLGPAGGTSWRRAQKSFDSFVNLVADDAEHGKLFLFGPGCVGRVLKRPMDRLFRIWKDRTGFSCSVANGDDQIERLCGEFIDRFAAVGGDVKADLFHRANRQRMHISGRSRSGRERFPLVSGQFVPQSFGHL